MPKKREVQFQENVIGWDDLRGAIIRARTKMLGMDCDPKDLGITGTVSLTYDGTYMHLEITTR